MSRCFQFPPPGYEKKTRSDDADLITKDKCREKRHKKDKKNKDRREDKEKKDEKRGKEKNREKKDRKEKKKDKKEKNKDREKTRTSDEKKIEGKPASYNLENPHPNNLPGLEINDSKIVQELGQRLGDKSKIAGIRMFQKVTLTDNGKPELLGSVVDGNIGSSAEGKRKSKGKNDMGKVNGQGNKVEARSPENAVAHDPGWMYQRRIEQGSIRILSEEKRKINDKSDAGRANGQGTKVEARVAEFATSHNSGWVDQRRVVQSNIGNWAKEKRKSNDKNDTGKADGQGNKVEARAPENPTVFNSPWMDQRSTKHNWVEEKGKTKGKEDAWKVNGQGYKVEARGPETAAVHTSDWMDQRRIEGIQVKEEGVEKKVGVKENGEHNGRDRGGDKKRNKDKDQEKKSKSKDKNRDKKKEKTEKMKGKRETDTKETTFKGSSQSSIDTQNIKPETLLKGNSKSISTSGNLGKRKELEANGLFHENHMQPNKLPRSIPSSHLVVENGLKLEPSQIITQFAPEKQGLPFNHKANIKEHKINGLAETHLSNSASTSSSSATVQTIEKCEASARLPHPDTKYLSQILSIPTLEECPNFDDQEWLFSHRNLQLKKMEVASPGFDGTMQVWAEALPIKSADVSALPYVIPF